MRTRLAHLSLLLAGVATSAILVGVFALSGEPEPPPKVWELYDQLVWAIQRCPEWTADSPRTAEEWRSLLETAALLQSQDPRDVEIALITYMVIDQHKHPETKSPQAWSKPMLLLRLMFEIPADRKGAAPSERLRACGGIRWRAAGDEKVFPAVSLPIEWNDEGPRLVVDPVYETLGGDLSGAYQPQVEHHEMAKRFKPRDLSRWAKRKPDQPVQGAPSAG